MAATRRVGQQREKKVVYKKPKHASIRRKKAKVNYLGEQTIKNIDSAAKLAFENHPWTSPARIHGISKEATRQLSRDMLRIIAETKLGYNAEQMKLVFDGLKKMEKSSLHTRKTAPELRKMLKEVDRLANHMMKQAAPGALPEEYAAGLLTNEGPQVTWKDRHGKDRHVAEYSVPKSELYRLVRFSAYEAAINISEARNRISQMIEQLKRNA